MVKKHSSENEETVYFNHDETDDIDYDDDILSEYEDIDEIDDIDDLEGY